MQFSFKESSGCGKICIYEKEDKMTAKGEGMKLEHAEQLPGFIKRNSENTNRHRAADEKASFTVFLLSRSPLLVCFIWHRF